MAAIDQDINGIVKDVYATVSKLKDSLGYYLGCFYG